MAAIFPSPSLGEGGRRPGEGDTVLSVVPEGWEVDTIEVPGRGTLPRVAWSRDANTVVYVAVSGVRRKLAVNGRFMEVDSVGPLGYTPDGLNPVFVTRSSGTETLHVGGRNFGPYESIEHPVLSSDGAHVAFLAKEGDEFIAVQDGKILARASYVGSPILDAQGNAAFWVRQDKRWTLLWKGKPAPGTPFTARASNTSLPEVSLPAFSPDGKHVAYSRRGADGRYAVVRDGRAGTAYLSVGDPVFSPDGDAMAYGASAGPDYELNTLVLDDRIVSQVQPKGRSPLSIRSLWGYRFLRDGRLTWFATLAGGRACFMLGEDTSADYESVAQPAFDPGNRRAAFAGFKSMKAHAVVDGSAGPPYDAVAFLQFDEEGRRFAYTAKLGTSSMVVLDGVAGEPFDEVGWVRFTPGGEGIAFWARKGTLWQTVVNGRKRDTSVRADMVGNLILLGSDGSVPVYSVHEDGAWHLIVGDRRAGPFDEIGMFTADTDPSLVACGTRERREFHRRLVPLTGTP